MPRSPLPLRTRRAARTGAVALALAAVGATQAGTASAATAPASGGCPMYAATFKSAGARYGVSWKVLSALAKVESACDPSARSATGARGLFQAMPAAGADLRTPATQTASAAKALVAIRRQVGSRLDFQLAAWNAGVGAVKRYHGVPPFQETRDFVNKVTRESRHVTG